MPTPTQTPDQDNLDPAKKNIDDIVDSRFGGKNQAAGDPSDPRGDSSSLKNRENQAAGDPSDPRDIAQREDGGDSNWNTNVTASSGKSASQKLKSFVGKKKRRGILASLALFLAILGIIGSLMSAAFGLVNLKETMVGKLSQRANNVMTGRVNRVMAKKMSQDLTSGCTTIKVKCRYKGMSTREVKKFNKRNMGNGVRVVTEPSSIPGRHKVIAIETYELKNGATIDKKGAIEGKTIKAYRAGEIKQAFKKDPKIFKAGVAFYKSSVQYHAGNVARGMFKRTGVHLGKKKVSDGKKARIQQDELINSAQGDGDHSMSESAKKQSEDVPDEVKEDIDGRTADLEEAGSDPSKTPTTPSPESPDFDRTYGRSARTIEALNGGLRRHFNPLSFLMNYCTLRMLVQTANQVRKIDQTIQLLKFSMIFYTLADQIKAGEADGDTAVTIGVAMSMLTTKDGNGLSAFDSMGYNWITRGAVRPGIGEDITKFQNGGSASGILGPLVGATTSGLGPICKLASSWKVTATMALAQLLSIVAGAFTGGAATGAYAAIRTGAVQGAKTFANKLIERKVKSGVKKYVKRKFEEKVAEQGKAKLAWKLINNKVSRLGAVTALFYFGTGPLIEVLARSASGTVTKGLVGPDAGNALVAGAGAGNSKTGQAQGFEPITPDEAVDQDKKALTASLERSKNEGVNQFDVTNQYAFANKFAIAMMPSMSKLSSVFSAPTALAGITSSAINGIGQDAYADSTKKLQYEYCRDDQYENADINIATDIFCNPQYGFDMSVIDGPEYDPEKVADYVHSNGLVDDEGEPTGDLTDFISKCIESETSVGQDSEGKIEPDCVKRDTKHRMMRIYCLDSSIDSDMKEEITNNCSTQDAEENSSGNNTAPDEIDLATLYEPSDSIACADGTKDLGTQDGYHGGSKMKIKICEIPKDILPSSGEESRNEYGVSGASGGVIVNSRVSKNVLEMAKAMKADNLPIIAACSSFRTMAHQEDLYRTLGGSGLVAKPGFSNHQSGVAIDLHIDNNSCGLSSYGKERPNNSPHEVWSWLKENADKYGYKQLSFEFWHWSPDGG